MSERTGVDYVGQYRCSSRARQVLKSLGGRVGIVVDWHLHRLMVKAGYELVPERDNKSEWNAQWIAKALGKYGTSVPDSLQQRVDVLSATRVARSGDHNSQSRTPAARPGPDGSRAQTETKRETSGGTGNFTSRARGRHEVSSGKGPDHGRTSVASHDRRSGCGSSSSKRNAEVYARAVAAAMASLGNRTRRREPYPVSQVVDRYIHPNHFSGAPYFCNNEEAIPRVLRDVAQIRSRARSLDPYVSGRRVQHGDAGPKGRLVWMAPLATTILATQFAKPVYEKLVGHPSLAYARTFLELGAITAEFTSKFERTYCLDFSAFDASLSAEIIDDAFRILRTHLELNEEDKEMFDRLINDFIHTRIVLPDSSMWQVHRGVPSGSAFTSLVDSVCNIIIINYIWIRLTGRAPEPDEVMVLGDDSIVGSNHNFKLATIAAVAKELGITLSVAKSRVTRCGDMIPFLGHEWKSGRPHRRGNDIAKRLAYPERYSPRLKDPAYSFLRLYCMTADAVEAHHLFLQVVETFSGDVEQAFRQSLLRVGSEEVDLSVGQGRLRYLEEVEDSKAVKSLAVGTRLAMIGRLY